MTYETTPTASVRAALKTLLGTLAGTGVKIYDYFPQDKSLQVPCVIMQQVAGRSKYPGVGEVMSTTEKAHTVRLIFQFDVYALSAAKRDEIADRILKIWESYSDLKDDDITLYPCQVCQDMPPPEQGDPNFRKLIQFPFEIDMTAKL